MGWDGIPGMEMTTSGQPFVGSVSATSGQPFVGSVSATSGN